MGCLGIQNRGDKKKNKESEREREREKRERRENKQTNEQWGFKREERDERSRATCMGVCGGWRQWAEEEEHQMGALHCLWIWEAWGQERHIWWSEFVLDRWHQNFCLEKPLHGFKKPDTWKNVVIQVDTVACLGLYLILLKLFWVEEVKSNAKSISY